jgi:bacteriocin-like protein
MEFMMKRKPTITRTGAAPADKLVAKATKNGDVELNEDELKKVSGGSRLGDIKGE